MWNVVQVPEDKLHRVCPSWQIDGGLRLPATEMDMIVIEHGKLFVWELFQL